ncbi:DUF4145 domain-containing protein [Psychromonas sp. 14N.309.X.WAT.B.A12]|uniref:DUF4145 domain-containing protein n=1 Tax=Psychromonas sp. 14N.309.X.WAT.B.A12 TaxID=2998322 RepID=UPI0025AF80E0|nr:DUF4145 domain-containing protein [Psychromonas sp. 14N.309.X.WAT.B.A12]MDN2664147.1 DUF4145 domain-containing protein [Psychromonas sp. 14N.309.X.WAT.B.A12]
MSIDNDKQFVALFGEPIATEYSNALMLMDVYADVSLMMFRKGLESLCLKVAKNYDYEFDNTDLCEQINELAKETFINVITKELLHKARQQTNAGVHLPENLIGKKEIRNIDITAHTKKLISNAIKVRKDILEILELVAIDLKVVKRIPKYALSAAGGQGVKELFYTCLGSTDHQKHFTLGIVYQSLAKERENFVLCNDGRSKVPNPYYRFANECFKSAFYFSTGLSISDISIKNKQGIKISPNGYESLFHYVMLSITEKIAEINPDEEQLILRALVKRKYSAAYPQLGWKKYLAGHYKEGAKLITHDKAIKDNFSLHKKGIIYLEGKACARDINLSIEYFRQASEFGCADSMFELAKIFHRGEYVKADIELAEECLNKAIKLGNASALKYMKNDFINPLGMMTAFADYLLKVSDFEIAKNRLKIQWAQVEKKMNNP